MRISEAYSTFQTYYLLNEDRSVKTIKEYQGRFFGRNGLITVLGDLDIEALGIDHVIAWKLHMREQGLQASYINHCVSALRWLLKWFSEETDSRVIDYHKIKSDKVEQHKPHIVLTPQETQRLIYHAPNIRDKAIISLFFGTGCRSAEILGLDRDQWESATLVDKENGIWEIYVLGKNSKYRPVCFYQDVKDLVDEYLETRKDRFKPLFTSLQNRRIHHNTVSRMLHATARKAGLMKRVTQHVLRHSYATEHGNAGMPIPTLAYSLGHKDGTVTQKIYVHINAAQSRRAYALYHPKTTNKP